LAAATIMQIAGVPANAQDNTTISSCQDSGIGQGFFAPLGDREGHSLSVANDSCRAESGPMAGGVFNIVTVWEWDGPKAVLLTQSGVISKPGATAVLNGIDGNVVLTMTDGKVTGWTSTGRHLVVMATGDWASLKGKTIAFKAKPTGPGSQYECDDTVE
jgi:hypothetical protein